MKFWIVILIVCLVAVVLVGFLALWIFSIRSKFSRLKEEVRVAFLSMEQQMKKRYDLVAKLIQISQNVFENGNENLEKVVQARYSCLASESIEEKEKNEPYLVKSLENLFFEAKKSKKSKKNQDFSEIEKQLEEIDVDILDAKRSYNAKVEAFNHLIDSSVAIFVGKKAKDQKAQIFHIDLT